MENISQQSNFDSIIQSLSKLDLRELDQVMSSLLGLIPHVRDFGTFRIGVEFVNEN